MRGHVAKWLRAFGLWRCGRGHHSPLVWKANNRRNPPKIHAGSATELMAAAGFFSLVRSIGWCPRCGEMIGWSSEKA